MRANVEHNHVLHSQILIVSIETLPVPHLPDTDRIQVDDLGFAGDGLVYVSVRFGYMDTPDITAALRLLGPDQTEGPITLDEATYYLSKIELTRGPAPTMAPWRKRLFIATSHVTADAAEFLGLPRDRTVIMGSRIDV
jgi:KUP system potassium uptake protein